MNKQAKQLIALAVILGICLAAFFGVSRYSAWKSDQDAAASEAAVVHVGELDSTINTISYTNSDGAFSFTLGSDGTWSYDGDAAFPLDQDYITDLVGVLNGMTATRALTTEHDLSDYGLTNPSTVVKASDQDGHSVTIDIGSAASDGSYYAMVEGVSDTIYVIDSDLAQAASLGLYDIVKVETFPSLSESRIESVTFNLNGTPLKLEKETVTSDATDGSGSTSTSTSYKWYVVAADGTKTAAEDYALSAAVIAGNSSATASTEVSSIVSALTGMTVASCYNYNADASALAGAGLDTRDLSVTINYQDTKKNELTCTLYIGSYSASNSIYAVQFDGSAAIDTISSTSVEKLLDAAEALVG